MLFPASTVESEIQLKENEGMPVSVKANAEELSEIRIKSIQYNQEFSFIIRSNLLNILRGTLFTFLRIL